MKKIVIFSIMLSSLLFGSESYADFLKAHQNEVAKYQEDTQKDFNKFKKDLEDDFNNYKALYKKELKKFETEIYSNWGDKITSSKTKWVEYSPNKMIRKIVDFEKSEIIIEIISKETPQVAEKLLYRESIKTIISSPKKAHSKDILTQRIDAKFKKIAKTAVVKKNIQDKKPILQAVIMSKNSSTKEIIRFISKAKSKTVIKPSKVGKSKVFSMKIKLPKYFPLKKAKQLKDKVRKYAKEYKIETALVYAIMHSESNFNPMAKSHIPAYGLMQIVPRSAGIDAYQMVYKKKRLLPASYLYDSRNNIEMGSAYLHILYYRYLKRIKNPESRLYCVIAGYNTGAGNVSRAFATGKRKGRLKRATDIINTMTPDQVYNALVTKLPHDETKVYLKKVSKRFKIYQRLDL